VSDAALRRVAVLEDGPAALPEYDQRMVGEPASSLVGVVFSHRAVQQAA
jgi:hypothetical protein